MSPAKALALIEPVLCALAAAHDAGILHRDVKPENVLLADDGRVKVADFGLARAINSETQHTATGGVLIGTVSYLSPELVVDGKADARADVYAAGVLSTRCSPATSRTRPTVRSRSPTSTSTRTSRPRPPDARGIPPYVDALVARATARDTAPAAGRRACPAPPGTPSPQRARPRRRQRPRPDGGPDADHPGRRPPHSHRRAAGPDHRAAGPEQPRHDGADDGSTTRSASRSCSRRRHRATGAWRSRPRPADLRRRHGARVAGRYCWPSSWRSRAGRPRRLVPRHRPLHLDPRRAQPQPRPPRGSSSTGRPLDERSPKESYSETVAKGSVDLDRPRARRPGAQGRHGRRGHLAGPRAAQGARRPGQDPRRRPAGARRRQARVRRCGRALRREGRRRGG